jgi:DNA-binding transcriptional LysR family regulator
MLNAMPAPVGCCAAMDLRQLEIIRAIAETGSFTAAGQKLGVSQSAISRQVLLLEEELNEAVFLRVGRRIRITPAGEALLQLSHRVFLDLKDTVARITDTQASLIGPVRLAGGMTVSLYVFPALLRDLRRHHPDADLKIVAGATDKCLASLRSGQADVALLTLPISDPDLITVPAMQEELLLVTAPGHPLAQRQRVTPADLRAQPFVLFEPGSNTRRVVDEFFLRTQIEPQVVTETENVEIIKALVRAGLGISIISYQSMAREVASGQFFCARMAGHPLIRETGWVYMRANRVPRAVQEVLSSFDRIKPKLRLAPPAGRDRFGHEPAPASRA